MNWDHQCVGSDCKVLGCWNCLPKLKMVADQWLVLRKREHASILDYGLDREQVAQLVAEFSSLTIKAEHSFTRYRVHEDGQLSINAKPSLDQIAARMSELLKAEAKG